MQKCLQVDDVFMDAPNSTRGQLLLAWLRAADNVFSEIERIVRGGTPDHAKMSNLMANLDFARLRFEEMDARNSPVT